MSAASRDAFTTEPLARNPRATGIDVSCPFLLTNAFASSNLAPDNACNDYVDEIVVIATGIPS